MSSSHRGAVRQPAAARRLYRGVPGAIQIEVTQNVTHNADSFRVALSLSQPKKGPAHGHA